MKTLYFTIILLLLHLQNNSSAQIMPGAKQIAISNSSLALSNDVFSHFTNPAGLAQINWSEIGIYYSPAPFGMTELSNAFAAYLQPTEFGSIAAGFMTYGFDLYRENNLSISYSNRFYDRIFLGATLKYHSISIKNYGSSKSFSLLLGLLYYISPITRIAFATDNITRSSYGDYNDQIPTIFSIGVSQDFLENIIINGSFSKELRSEYSLHFGIDYLPIQFVSLRFGFSTEPASFSGGVGINYSKFEFDYASFNHQDLGFTHQFSIILHFSEDKPRNKKIKDYLVIE